ncbi:MAG: type II toxin-antitoxin system Phd/YefM family antitoxin [Chloroflexi bacterium]|jgi:prevent-host-death family protein|nr:type II toxin-antitoxin system Phd/YefM family antitoxin [Chloroflexota bacterium]
MIKVSATDFRKNLFDYLDKTAAGEIIIIQRNNQEIARLLPMERANWRDQMTTTPQLLVSPVELIQPLDDIWEAYV